MSKSLLNSKQWGNLDSCLDIQRDEAKRGDPYMRGMYNGMVFVKSCILNTTPDYMGHNRLENKVRHKCRK